MSARQAVIYMRTSSQTNVEGDSRERQLTACLEYAKRHKLAVSGQYYDGGVSGTVPVTERGAFMSMIERLLSNGVRTVLVETPDRFARDLTVQLVGHDWLKAKGITLIPVSAPSHFVDETPTATMIRQILGAVSQFEKAQVTAKLQGARDRKSQAAGKRIEGATLTHPDAHVLRARELRESGLTLQAIADQMSKEGMRAKSRKKYHPQQVKRMITGWLASERE